MYIRGKVCPFFKLLSHLLQTIQYLINLLLLVVVLQKYEWQSILFLVNLLINNLFDILHGR